MLMCARDDDNNDDDGDNNIIPLNGVGCLFSRIIRNIITSKLDSGLPAASAAVLVCARVFNMPGAAAPSTSRIACA